MQVSWISGTVQRIKNTNNTLVKTKNQYFYTHRQQLPDLAAFASSAQLTVGEGEPAMLLA